MSINTLCGDAGRIDFNDPVDLRAILYQDKHARVEGLCSEVAFMEDVVKGNLDPVTSDFWFSGEGAGYHIRKIITKMPEDLSGEDLLRDPGPLSELDYRILDGFARIKELVTVSIVYFDEPTKTFRQFRHEQFGRYKQLKGLGSVMPSGHHHELAEEKERDPVRLAKACAYLEERGLLKDMAIKRLFANCWLGKNVLDIDVFTWVPKQDGRHKVVAFEVKQKFPTRKETFGVNDGQKNLFDFLTKNGMPVVHVILKKPENDDQLHGIDLLTLPEYTDRTEWIFTRYAPEKLVRARKLAPRRTHIHGQSGMAYHHVASQHFAVLKKFGQPEEGVAAQLLAGI